MPRPAKPEQTIRRARQQRRTMSLPEVLLWRELMSVPEGLRFRRQHPAGQFVLDFFCARANLAIEIDGISHDMGSHPQRDMQRDEWFRRHHVDTLRIPASEVLRDPNQVAEMVMSHATARLVRFGKTPPSALRAATSPSQVDGEDRCGCALPQAQES